MDKHSIGWGALWWLAALLCFIVGFLSVNKVPSVIPFIIMTIMFAFIGLIQIINGLYSETENKPQSVAL